MGLRWRFESAGGYHSLPIWRYLHLLWIANHGAPYPRARLGDDLTGQGLWRLSSTIVDLLGVQWVVTPHDRPVEARGWVRRFAGGDGVDLWENRHTFPRAFVVYAAERVADDAAAARAVASPTWNPAHTAIVEEDVGLPPPAVGAAVPPTQATQLVREGPAALLLEVPVTRPGIVILGEPWYPGWRVTVDGKPAASLRVDYALRGVRLDPGVHIIEWELTCPPLRAGGAITIVALLGAAALGSIEGRRRRRAERAARAA
jgi:hypothetical protein